MVWQKFLQISFVQKSPSSYSPQPSSFHQLFPPPPLKIVSPHRVLLQPHSFPPQAAASSSQHCHPSFPPPPCHTSFPPPYVPLQAAASSSHPCHPSFPTPSFPPEGAASSSRSSACTVGRLRGPATSERRQAEMV
eukprot:GHVS01046305.1.p2 GENE.GHVS01046305.1~~GHVS01046305.1.p2  ORF type:complete len:135 (-),score=46.32 GHVS01046305.1:80-484(-)